MGNIVDEFARPPLAALAVLGWLARGPAELRSGRQNEMQNARLLATGAWTFEIGSEFELLDNGDSVQAVHGNRLVFVSSLRVGTSEAPVPAAQIRSAAARRLGSGERISHVGRAVQGDAEVRPDGDTWRLDGTMCADGTVATCVIEFLEGDQPWAVSVWKSLRCGSEVA